METTQLGIKKLEATDSYGKFVVEPLERGYGVTLGNSLRRVMLSSIPGAAITYVKIDKVLHEFSTIPGVKEDTTELLLNLKNLNLKVYRNGSNGSEPQTVRVDVKGSKEGSRVTGADVQCPSGVEVVNPEVYIATISDEDATLSMELTVETAKGYVPPDKLERRSQQAIGVIPVGAAFTPVRKVNYIVEPTRVGSNTNFERLVLEVTTNGSIAPGEAIQEAARILQSYFGLFSAFEGAGQLPAGTPEGIGEIAETDERYKNIRIEELDFSVRTYNCLKKANILTIADLVQYTENDLMQIRNFGRKSLTEVREKLSSMALSLKGGATVGPDDEGEGDEGDEE